MRDIRERTFDFALRIIKLCRQLEEQQGVARTLGWQLLLSGTSIGANVEEAQAGQSKPDLISKKLHLKKRARPSIGYGCSPLQKWCQLPVFLISKGG